jgi:hypothetical protein
MEKEKNILLCMNGNLTIDGNRYKRYDHLRIKPNQEYLIDEWNDAEVAIFSSESIEDEKIESTPEKPKLPWPPIA